MPDDEQVTESFLNEKSAVGMESQKPAKQDGNDTIILSHHPCFANYALSLLCAYRRVVEGSGVGSAGCVVHAYRRVVEDSGVGSAGCVVHVDVHGE